MLPMTFYGEGLRRALLRFGGRREGMTGWRGRLAPFGGLTVVGGVVALALWLLLLHLVVLLGWLLTQSLDELLGRR
ncbi:MAG: hypothetical protein M3Q22_06335, partial [Actinomycetota bacterium]|nr:hypothetical protein [Actinomycetota bacterium]